ncbi:hypothetical protein L204_100115 [Cryptococcus depauperatus]|nr:ataxin-3 [Cryptococcus depauperatus CBS 7855]
MDLVPYIYYEKQESGSQLCAQHCLNNLLQQYTYSEIELADIAKELDKEENANLHVDHQNKESFNFDDTGFFSISVLERALEVWDLIMVRWRGEAMRPYQDCPEMQFAFILNLSSHWLTLRRFAPDPPHSAAIKRWYNLNSFLPEGPEWISPLYLRMVLTQAEEEGYSVFVIRKASPGTAAGQKAGEGEGWGDTGIGRLPECLADMMSVQLGEPVGRMGGPQSGASSITIGGPPKSQGPKTQNTVHVDSINSSGTAGPSSPPRPRKKRQADLPSDHVEIVHDPYSQSSPSCSHQLPSRSNPNLETDVFDNIYAIPSNDNNDNQEGSVAEDEIIDSNFGINPHSYSGPTDFQFQSRSYDDEDKALQAALKASMADLPEGWVAPDIKQESTSLISKTSQEAPVPITPTPPIPESSPIVKNDKLEDDDDLPAEELTAEEIRRRRLAKFG